MRQKSSLSSTTSSSLTQETFQSLHQALRLAEAYMEKYTKKKVGRSIIRAWNVNDDRSKFEEIKEKIDRCIDRLPIVQIMDQDERYALAEKRRMSEFTELKRVIDISVEEILNETHDSNETIIDIMRGFKEDLYQFITNEAGSMFNLKFDELSSLRVDIDDKLAILDARQKEILETLRGVSTGVNRIDHNVENIYAILAKLQLNPNSKLNEVDTQIREDNLSRLRLEPSSF